MTVVPDRPVLEVVEYTDPLCPWAWGSEPVFRRLRAALDGRVRRRRASCILFDHDDDPPPDPAAEAAWYARYVEDISTHTQAPRALRPSRVAASSWPSSLVAKAAEPQGADVAERVLRGLRGLRGLRESVFVLGKPADTPAPALSAVRGTPGLDSERPAADAASSAVLERVRADRAEARRPVGEVLSAHGESPHPGTAKETADGEYPREGGPGQVEPVTGARPLGHVDMGVPQARQQHPPFQIEDTLTAGRPRPPAGALLRDDMGG
ncbi:DsbA family oxidoreductase [Streptomyces mirabilis]|uniref:DsbA family oxidoreductase n=1 Tax=Streptomyces mirabilis TaxID=68239 RepID=UPI0036E3B5FE